MPAVKRPRKKKFFSVDEANKMLPLVRAIVQDIVVLAEELRERQERLGRIQPRKRSAGDVYDEEYQQMQQELAREAAHMEEYVDELRRLGVELKGWDGWSISPAGSTAGRSASVGS